MPEVLFFFFCAWWLVFMLLREEEEATGGGLDTALDKETLRRAFRISCELELSFVSPCNISP